MMVTLYCFADAVAAEQQTGSATRDDGIGERGCDAAGAGSDRRLDEPPDIQTCMSGGVGSGPEISPPSGCALKLGQPFQPCQKGVLSSPAARRAFLREPGRTSVSARLLAGSQWNSK